MYMFPRSFANRVCLSCFWVFSYQIYKKWQFIMVWFASFKIMSIFLYAQGPFDFLFFLCLPLHCAALGILIPRPGNEPLPLSVKILSTGLPENSLIFSFQVVQGTESACQCWTCKREMWVWSLGQEDSLKEEMVTHSSILAWEIPQTEEPGRQRPMDHRVRQGWAPTNRMDVNHLFILLSH